MTEPTEREMSAQNDAVMSPGPSVMIICGVNQGESKRFACPCCGWESDDIEAFATSMCWPCVSGNPECERCREHGVPVDDFDSERGKLHRFVRWNDEQCAEVVCGLLTIPRECVGQATGVRRWCAFCWPEGPR